MGRYEDRRYANVDSGAHDGGNAMAERIRASVEHDAVILLEDGREIAGKNL